MSSSPQESQGALGPQDDILANKCCILCSAQFREKAHLLPAKINYECPRCHKLFEESSTKDTQHYVFPKKLGKEKGMEVQESKGEKVQNQEENFEFQAIQEKKEKSDSWESYNSETEASLQLMLNAYPVLKPQEERKFKEYCKLYGRDLLTGNPFKDEYKELKYFQKPWSSRPFGVYKATKLSTGETVAIKVCTSCPLVDFLQGEISSRQKMKNHESSIVKVHTPIWYENKIFYMIMEYFSCDLHLFFKWVKHKEIVIQELYLAFIIKKVLHALCKLHASGYYHGDVTPHNIFLSSHFKVKLGDLGKCRRLTALNRQTIHEGKSGFTSNQKKKGEEEDIYQLGRTLLFYFHFLQRGSVEAYFSECQLHKFRRISKSKQGPLPSEICSDFMDKCLSLKQFPLDKLLTHKFIEQTRNPQARLQWSKFKDSQHELLALIELKNVGRKD